MVFRISKGMLIPLMVLNFCLYLIAAAIAGAVLNQYLDASAGVAGTSSPAGEYFANQSKTVCFHFDVYANLIFGIR